MGNALTRRRLAPIIGSLLAGALSSPAGAAELALDVRSKFIVPVEINGVTLNLRVDPAASGLVVLNPDAAQRARLEGETAPPLPYFSGIVFRNAFARIGPVSLTGKTSGAAASIGGQAVPLRMIWFRRDVDDEADGVISVELLPYDRVTMRLADPREPETETRLGLEYQTGLGLYYPYRLEALTVPVQFSFRRVANVATAAAGAHIARSHAGAWQGGHGRQPISFSIDRPVRAMALGRPIDLRGFPVGQFLVRISDHRGAFVLPSDAPADPDEIVVTATSGEGQPSRLNLVLGLGQFSACSSLTYTKADRQLVLKCAAPPS